MRLRDCKNCGHPERDHHGYQIDKDGNETPLDGCFWAENRGYQEDLCVCPRYE